MAILLIPCVRLSINPGEPVVDKVDHKKDRKKRLGKNTCKQGTNLKKDLSRLNKYSTKWKNNRIF